MAPFTTPVKMGMFQFLVNRVEEVELRGQVKKLVENFTNFFAMPRDVRGVWSL